MLLRARIIDKSRDIIVLPSGEHRVAFMGIKGIADFLALLQIQTVQKMLEHLEVRLVTRGPFGAEDEEKLREALGQHSAISCGYHDKIPHSAGGTSFDFVSEAAG